jgi:galactose mutarotase-like enzyme
MDHYPGGWQDCLPLAGVEGTAHGARYGLHGETPLIGWTVDLPQQPDEVAELTCSVKLVRYPLTVTRHLELDGNGLHVTWELVNESQCRLPIVWLQHLAFGEPLLGPEARIELPDCWVTVDDEPQGESPLDPGKEFAWPTSDHGTDMRVVQPRSAGIHDLSYLHELDAGTYTVRNPDQNLAATVRFDQEVFGCLWCWRAFGGFTESPFFGREYVLGLEPATGWPASNVPQSQGEDGTQSLQYLEPGETLTTWMDLTVFEP